MHWLLAADYPHTAAGLIECFVAALPFHRWMPVGDVVWSLAVFGGLAVAQAGLPGRPAACVERRGESRAAAAARRLD